MEINNNNNNINNNINYYYNNNNGSNYNNNNMPLPVITTTSAEIVKQQNNIIAYQVKREINNYFSLEYPMVLINHLSIEEYTFIIEKFNGFEKEYKRYISKFLIITILLLTLPCLFILIGMLVFKFYWSIYIFLGTFIIIFAITLYISFIKMKKRKNNKKYAIEELNLLYSNNNLFFEFLPFKKNKNSEGQGLIIYYKKNISCQEQRQKQIEKLHQILNNTQTPIILPINNNINHNNNSIINTNNNNTTYYNNFNINNRTTSIQSIDCIDIGYNNNDNNNNNNINNTERSHLLENIEDQ